MTAPTVHGSDSVPRSRPVSHMIVPPRSATRPRIDCATPSLPSRGGLGEPPVGMPGPSSRTLISTAPSTSSSSTQAGASAPTCSVDVVQRRPHRGDQLVDRVRGQLDRMRRASRP